jgi:hypothetical protein
VASLVAVVAIGTLAALGLLGALQPGALMFLPALLLAAALFAGHYPGERLIARWARARPRARQAVVPVIAPARPSLHLLRGGRLIAVSLAGRAPPALAVG